MKRLLIIAAIVLALLTLAFTTKPDFSKCGKTPSVYCVLRAIVDNHEQRIETLEVEYAELISAPTPTPVVIIETVIQTVRVIKTVKVVETVVVPVIQTVIVTATPTPLPTPTAAPVPENTELTFAVIGDFGWVEEPTGAWDVVDLIDSWNVDFILTTGDNDQRQGTAEQIQQTVAALYPDYIARGDFYPALGNHDWGLDTIAPYLEYFDLPGNERYYDFVVDDIHFWALDSDPREPDGISVGSVQAQWFEDSIKNSQEKYNIVYFHHPPYNSHRSYKCSACIEMRWPFAELGVDLVMSGHAHVYERAVRDGVTYITNGLGGARLAELIEGQEPVVGSVRQFEQEYGALRITSLPEYLYVELVTIHNEVIDSFAITKGT